MHDFHNQLRVNLRLQALARPVCQKTLRGAGQRQHFQQRLAVERCMRFPFCRHRPSASVSRFQVPSAPGCMRVSEPEQIGKISAANVHCSFKFSCEDGPNHQAGILDGHGPTSTALGLCLKLERAHALFKAMILHVVIRCGSLTRPVLRHTTLGFRCLSAKLHCC